MITLRSHLGPGLRTPPRLWGTFIPINCPKINIHSLNDYLDASWGAPDDHYWGVWAWCVQAANRVHPHWMCHPSASDPSWGHERRWLLWSWRAQACLFGLYSGLIKAANIPIYWYWWMMIGQAGPWVWFYFYFQCCITVDTVCALLATAERYIQYKCTKFLLQKVLRLFIETLLQTVFPRSLNMLMIMVTRF